MKKLSLFLIAVLLVSLLCGTVAGAEANTVTVQCGTSTVTLKGENTDGRIFALLRDSSQKLIAVRVKNVGSHISVDFGGKAGTVAFLWLDATLCPVPFENTVSEGPAQGADELNIA